MSIPGNHPMQSVQCRYLKRKVPELMVGTVSLSDRLNGDQDGSKSASGDAAVPGKES